MSRPVFQPAAAATAQPVAPAFLEEMVADRPDRFFGFGQVLPEADGALEEVDRGAGSQFDPKVAAALRAVVEWHSGGDGDRRLRAEAPGRPPLAL